LRPTKCPALGMPSREPSSAFFKFLTATSANTPWRNPPSQTWIKPFKGRRLQSIGVVNFLQSFGISILSLLTPMENTHWFTVPTTVFLAWPIITAKSISPLDSSFLHKLFIFFQTPTEVFDSFPARSRFRPELRPCRPCTLTGTAREVRRFFP